MNFGNFGHGCDSLTGSAFHILEQVGDQPLFDLLRCSIRGGLSGVDEQYSAGGQMVGQVVAGGLGVVVLALLDDDGRFFDNLINRQVGGGLADFLQVSLAKNSLDMRNGLERR